MIRLIEFFVIIAILLVVSSCETTRTGGGRVESCGSNMRYCSPGL